jgi:hypothetical protein
MREWHIIGLCLLAIVPLVAFGFPGLVIFIIGFWPTAIALFLDRNPQLYMTTCVGYLNFSGIFSQLIILWLQNNSLRYALDLISNSQSWYVIYGSSLIGVIIYFCVPWALAPLLSLWAAIRIRALRKMQKLLLEEWDESVKELALKESHDIP